MVQKHTPHSAAVLQDVTAQLAGLQAAGVARACSSAFAVNICSKAARSRCRALHEHVSDYMCYVATECVRLGMPWVLCAAAHHP